MELGFVNILAQVVKTAQAGQPQKKSKKKMNKFIKDVLLDIGRFMDYKKKMIGFWKIASLMISI